MDDDNAVAELLPHDADLPLYDYFKHLSSLVLITLGGLLLVLKDFSQKDLKPGFVLVTFLFVSAAGIVSFTGTQEIVRAKCTGQPARWLDYQRIAAPSLLAFGLGVFLTMFCYRLVQ